MQSFRYAFRALIRRPAFAVAVLALGLCLQATAAIFSVVRSVLLSPQAAGLSGCLAPACRAMRSDPATAPRAE